MAYHAIESVAGYVMVWHRQAGSAMIVFLHGFDWATYTDVVMPAFARWLLERDESAVATLFEQTRCAQEEEALPAPMQRLRSWVRARAFVQSCRAACTALRNMSSSAPPKRSRR